MSRLAIAFVVLLAARAPARGEEPPRPRSASIQAAGSVGWLTGARLYDLSLRVALAYRPLVHLELGLAGELSWSRQPAGAEPGDPEDGLGAGSSTEIGQRDLGLRERRPDLSAASEDAGASRLSPTGAALFLVRVPLPLDGRRFEPVLGAEGGALLSASRVALVGAVTAGVRFRVHARTWVGAELAYGRLLALGGPAPWGRPEAEQRVRGAVGVLVGL